MNEASQNQTQPHICVYNCLSENKAVIQGAGKTTEIRRLVLKCVSCGQAVSPTFHTDIGEFKQEYYNVGVDMGKDGEYTQVNVEWTN